jgi:hypothetical protein
LATDQRPEPPTLVIAAPAERASRAGPAPGYTRWVLLNPRSARHTSGFSVGVLSSRRLSGAGRDLGYSVAWSEGLTTLRGAFLAGARLEHELRLVPKDALELGGWRYYWEGGARLGPVEPQTRVGVTLLCLDYGKRVSVGMFSPRIGVGVWIKLGQTRIGLSVASEYHWRFIGEDSAFVHGLTLEVQPDAPALLGPRPTSWPAPRAQP